MKFYKHLYVGDTVTDPQKVKRKLKLHAGVSVYVLVLARDPDQLEFFHAGYLKQKYYRSHPPIIVGLASGEQEAMELVVRITQECLDATGGCDLKEYLRQRARG